MEIASRRIDPVNHHSSFDFSATMECYLCIRVSNRSRS